ncbi:MAG TPA: ABC transporter ATP-binding protein [Solirubrobacterales bacterium]|nr:ABC transporter ATP-binding protein [Solirubrobacterales bacterium]
MSVAADNHAGPATKELLDVRDLTIAFPAGEGLLLAADRIDFKVEAGRTVGLVGESGCGKSVTLRSLLGLVPYPGEILSGEISWQGEDLRQVSRSRLQQLRGTEISMVFQDPTACLNPVFTIGDQMSETLRKRAGLGSREARARAVELLDRVGVPSPERRLRAYPHQLSGGMRQRVMIAIAISAEPKLLLADEPTTALDVTTQEQILALLMEFQRENGMAIVLVSHDLGVISETCDEVVVMYAGRMLEAGFGEAVMRSPRHPYTRGLIEAMPSLEVTEAGPGAPIPGQPPNLADLPPGCPFSPRCPHSRPECDSIAVALDADLANHGSACPFVGASV